jgi:hypothetical protein
MKDKTITLTTIDLGISGTHFKFRDDIKSVNVVHDRYRKRIEVKIDGEIVFEYEYKPKTSDTATTDSNTSRLFD